MYSLKIGYYILAIVVMGILKIFGIITSINIVYLFQFRHVTLTCLYWHDCKPEGALFLAEFVCLSVCLSVGL